MDFHSGEPLGSTPVSATFEPSHASLQPLLLNHADEGFNPRDLIDEGLEKYNSVNSKHFRSGNLYSNGSIASSRGSFTADNLKRLQHSAIPFMARMSALLIATGSLLLALQYDPLKSIVPTHDISSGILAREPVTQADDDPNGTLAVGLIISSVATQFVALTAPFLLGTIAYRLGFDWCKASQELNYERLPTQDQYGLLLDTFTAANVIVMWRTGVHLLQRTGRRAKAPPILLQGFFLSCILFFLARILGLADLALHSTTSSIVLQAVNTQDNTDTVYGTFVNHSAVIQGSSALIKQEGVLTAANQSVTNQVFTLNSQSRMAYTSRVIGNIASDVSFVAPSLGIESQCAPITLLCFNQFPEPISGYYSQSAFNCSPAGYHDYHQSINSTVPNVLAIPVKAVSNGNGSNGIISLNRNPFPLVFIHFIRDADDEKVLKYHKDALVPAIGREGYFIIVACNISVYDATLRYSQGVYTMVNRSLSSPESSSFVTSRISLYANYYSQNYPDTGTNEAEENTLLSTLTDDIRYSAANNGQELGEFISADLSRLLLSYSAGYLNSGPAHAVAYTGVITQYNTAALAFTLVLIFLYSLLSFFVFGWASTARLEPVSHIGLAFQEQSTAVSQQGLVRNAQSRLCRPSTLVHTIYAPGTEYDVHMLPRPDGYFLQKEEELFEGEHACEKLAIAWPAMGPVDRTARLRAVVDSPIEEASGTRYAGPKYRVPFGTPRLLAIMIFLGTSMLATGLICWISFRRYRPLNMLYPYITVKEPSRSSNTQFVTLATPLLLASAAFRVGVDWLESSASNDFHNLPTPYQYGLLVNLTSMGGFGVLMELATFLKNRTHRMKAPRLLVKAFMISAVLFLLTRVIGLADLALHSTTTTGPLSSVNAVNASSSIYQFGTIVTPFNSSPFNDTISYGGNGPYATRLEGILTSGNRSAVNSVFTLGSNDLAYITRVNGLIPAGVSFIAPTIAISAQCDSITTSCFNSSQLSGNGFDCSPAGYPEISSNLFTETQFTVPDDQWSANTSIKNPFMAFWQSTLEDPVDQYQFGDLLVNISGTGAYLVMACNITVYDIFLHYTSDTYTLVNQTIATGATAAFVTYPLDEFASGENNRQNAHLNETFPIIPRFLDDLQQMNPTATEFGSAVSPDIARLLLAFSAGVLQPAPAAEVTTDGVVTRYPFIPLAIYISLVYLYALVALGIFVSSATGHIFEGTADVSQQNRDSLPFSADRKTVKELTRRAQWHISQPSSLVEALFESSLEDEGDEGYALEGIEDKQRIAVGLREQTGEDGSNKRLVFGVWKVTPAFKEK
ncbi:hypothetical protein HWV62_3452 [Athelia sp. TMB]|nr:hypothetical protein HWV62_3452 [Athelia sp. TMB]